MHIAYLTNQYPAVSHTFIRRELRALEARGHRLFRYSIRTGPGLVDADDIAEQSATRYALPLSPARLAAAMARGLIGNPAGAARATRAAWRYSNASRRGLLVHLAYLAEAFVIADWCRRDRIEHLHVHFGTNPATVGALVHELSGVPFSFTVHGPEEFDRADEHGLGAKVAAAAFVAAVSSFGRSQLMRWTAFGDWNKIKIVHCGLDSAYLEEPSQVAAAGRSLLCVARLAEQKGHFTLLEAASKLRDRGLDFRLRIIGDGPQRALMEARIKALGLSRHVQLLGSQTQAQIRQEIRASRALVLPSFAEGLPVVLMEAMAMGRPVVSTYVAGIPELVDAESGWLVPAGDPDALSVAMRSALEADQATTERMGESARKRVQTRHNVDVSAQLLERYMMDATPNASPRSLTDRDQRLASDPHPVADEIDKKMRRRQVLPAAE